MFFKKYGDIVISIFYLALATAMIIMANMLPKSTVTSLGPEFMPIVIGIVTLILAAILLITSIRGFKANLAAIEAGDEKDDSDYKRVLGSFIMVLAYVMILRPVGFIISTIVYLPIQMLILSPEEQRSTKNSIKLTILAVIFTMVVFFLFRYGFKIMLPNGIIRI